MSMTAMNYISNLMASLSIPYAFMEWKEKPPEDRYFVGEPSEVEMITMEEDGRQDSTLILRGFTFGDWQTLLQDADTIRRHLPITAILPDGTGIAVFYSNARFVPTGDARLKSIKINLELKEWKVN